ncbi:MAG: polysaccharide deacetylase, partial [Frankiales bacterium]|nr:polysaccharide deacetylase [Frankiales bacterium]
MGRGVNSKQVKWAVLGVVIALAATVGIILGTNRSGDDAAGPGPVLQTVTVPPSEDIYGKPTGTGPATTSASPSTPESSASAAAGSEPGPGTSADSSPESSAPESSAPVDPSGRKPTNIPMTKLAPGEKAPQFVIFSFDGVGSSAKMHEFLDAAAPSDARFTGFLTGTYLLDDTHADAYQGPGANPGQSEVGFGGDDAEITQRITDLNQAYLAGNEIGTHYNGHFCG